jgi:hypothetical protein
MSDPIPSSADERVPEQANQGPITRQALYDLVWATPMLKVAARFGAVQWSLRKGRSGSPSLYARQLAARPLTMPVDPRPACY